MYYSYFLLFPPDPTNNNIPQRLTTTVGPPTTASSNQQCTPGFSTWFNQDNPSTGSGDSERLTGAALSALCPGGSVTNIECQTVDGIPYYSTGEILTCDMDHGLVCSNADNFPIPCSDYQIRYECTCAGKKYRCLLRCIKLL